MAWTNQEYRARRGEARRRFDGSERLFNACWRELLWYERNADVCGSEIEVDSVLHGAASRRVNNERSSFWIYGE
jgi:hypothetical protein